MLPYVFLILIAFLVANCGVYFDEVSPIEETASVKAGDTMSVTLHTVYKVFGPKNDLHLIAGFLAPKSWKAAQNAKVYFTSNITTGIQPMVILPATELPTGGNGMNWVNATKAKYGYGSNVINDLEWVLFWSTNTYSVDYPKTPLADIFIKVKTGPENLSYKRGYFISESIDAFNIMAGSDFNQAFFTPCFAVTEGEGDNIDFCNPKIGTVEPSNALRDDIITLKYDGDLDSTKLKNEADVYLCAKAFTSTTKTVNVCTPAVKTKMRLWGTHRWRIDFWPKKYFGLLDTDDITKIEYFFTDKTGKIKTGYANTKAPFVYTFKCK